MKNVKRAANKSVSIYQRLKFQFFSNFLPFKCTPSSEGFSRGEGGAVCVGMGVWGPRTPLLWLAGKWCASGVGWTSWHSLQNCAFLSEPRIEYFSSPFSLPSIFSHFSGGSIQFFLWRQTTTQFFSILFQFSLGSGSWRSQRSVQHIYCLIYLIP